jgi:hypothetical protein
MICPLSVVYEINVPDIVSERVEGNFNESKSLPGSMFSGEKDNHPEN